MTQPATMKMTISCATKKISNKVMRTTISKTDTVTLIRVNNYYSLQCVVIHLGGQLDNFTTHLKVPNVT